jgi:Tol biopolymer transport system component/predicted Ser/Thr protein kinase
MNPERHREAGELFVRLRELPEDQLSAALDRACSGNAEVRAQVLRLVAADREAGPGFLEDRAVEQAARLLTPEGGGLPAAGTVIGNYRLGGQIGAGGMGVVYEGQDLRLGRRVALKILPLPFREESDESVRRFQREARAASTLNHPHIVAIFDAHAAEGYHYIAMEFVEGQTLRQIIRERKPLDSQTILDWIGQTAAALGAAHEAGIVHRDIKPENIMIRPDGFVKVLDFGLAKLREPAGGGQNQPEFRTRPGNLAGTIHYLPPEQILGQPAGPLGDLFSLGVVAYELATGVHPFDGPTDGAVFNAVLNHVPPPPSAVRSSAGPELDTLVMRSIEKDPALRFRTAEDLRSTCLRISRGSGTHATEKDSAPAISSEATPAARIPFWWLTAGAAGAALLAAAVWYTRPLPPLRASRIVQITSDGLPKDRFVNDGARLYYASRSEDSRGQQIFQASVKGGKPVPMPGLEGMFPVDISPDRAELLLEQELPDTANGPYPLWVASTVGGALRRLGDLRAEDAHWSPKGDEIVYTLGSALRIARSDGSGSRQLAVVNGSPELPVWSPDGHTIRFTLQAKNSETLWETSTDGRRPHPLLPDWRNWPHRDGVWTADGKYFIFSARRGTRDLWSVPEARGLFRPVPAPVRLSTGPLIADRPETSPDSHRLFFVGGLNRAELVRYDPKLRQWTPYMGGLPALQLDYSRDGRWVTYTSYTDRSVWRSAVDGSQQMQLTAPPLLAVNPCWSPDGSQVAFFGGAPGEPSRIYVVPAGGGAVRQLSHGEMGPGGDADPSWSPDGKELVFGGQSNDPQTGFELRVIDLKTLRIRKLADSEGLWSPRWSPDGVWIAALEVPVFKLCLYNVQTRARKELTPMGVGWPRWSRDSRYIYFEDNQTTAWFRVNPKDGKVERLASLSTLKFAPSGLGWIGLTPEGSLISANDAGSTEIYALDWEGP